VLAHKKQIKNLTKSNLMLFCHLLTEKLIENQEFVFSPDQNGILLFSFFDENKRYSGELE